VATLIVGVICIAIVARQIRIEIVLERVEDQFL
jgi:hypothetical protein